MSDGLTPSERVRRAIGVGRSAALSGEPWSAQAEETTREALATLADHILVDRDALHSLLRRVDPGGFQSNDLGVSYVGEPGAQTLAEIAPAATEVVL